MSLAASWTEHTEYSTIFGRYGHPENPRHCHGMLSPLPQRRTGHCSWYLSIGALVVESPCPYVVSNTQRSLDGPNERALLNAHVDEVMASNDGSTAINISTVNDGWYGPTLTYTWTVPQDIELSDPLVRAYLYVNGSKTVDSISTGIVIGDHLAGTNGSNARGLDTKKLDSGSVAGLVFFSTLFLATSALLLFLTSQSMFRTRQRGCSGKVKGKVVVKVEKPDRGFELGAVTKKGYSQVRHKDSGTVQESFAETTL